MNNRFIVYVTYNNAEKYLHDCLSSIYSQDYDNFKLIIIDDASTDNSDNIVKNFDQNKILYYIKNKENLYKLQNVAMAFNKFDLDDEDILLLIDGDDKLTHKNVLNQLNEVYKKNNILVTYGSFISSDGKINLHDKILENNFDNLRKDPFVFSHLKTFKYKCFKEIEKQDNKLKCFKDNKNNFYTMTDDVAIMLPIIEIAGIDKTFYDNRIHYFYRLHDRNDSKINKCLQTSIKYEIFGKKKFNLKNFEEKWYDLYRKQTNKS